MRRLLSMSAPLLLAGLLSGPSVGFAQSTEDCMMCHEDPSLISERTGQRVSLNLTGFQASVHGSLECIDCHADLSGAELPHAVPLAPVDCGLCHDDIAGVYKNSMHGRMVEAGAPLAPRCWDCHGSHDIVGPTAPNSRVTKFQIPFMCGRCHKEGTPVSQTYDIPQDSIQTHYSFGVHAEGLYQKGLTVSAVCTDCHTAHNVLPHTDPSSSIHASNIPSTCQKCHGRIEDVHAKVIRGELWEKEPHKIPVCIDCHEPHRTRRLVYEESISDKECMTCHAQPALRMVRGADTISLFIDSTEMSVSVHHRSKVACAQCHTGATPFVNERPCATVAPRVDCGVCHAQTDSIYATSTHGKLANRGDLNAPSCTDCHGTHGVRDRRDQKSPTYPINVPKLCAQCHREGEKAAIRYTGTQHDIIEHYTESIHGKGLLESGLVVTAMCTNCHTAHHVLPKEDPQSSVNHENAPQTCARCHNGIFEKFSRSIHSATVSESDKKLPSCIDCHSSHTISRTGDEGFKLAVTAQCSECHKDVTETYFETFHGKVSKLGYTVAAKCYDCHGSHDILPPSEPESHLSRANIVETCAQCHPGSNRRFAGYLTHATHHDKDKYPILYYTFWFMSTLLIGTLALAGTHTLMWLPRSFQAMQQHKKIEAKPHRLEFKRFTRRQRQMHILVVISFLGLALTGMTLKFSYLGWAQFLSRMFGGFESASFVHRVCAVITFGYFAMHLHDVWKRRKDSNKSWFAFLLDTDSMLPNTNDWQDLKATIKWFIGMGPRPRYGRWTYWEKFDYFAVFWGVIVIGSTGLMLWFPEFFTKLLPGWFINVATIIHSDEALLAVGFIFTVHFFNTHFRPDKFPMDTVIFTGRVTIQEFRMDRPREFEELVRTRQLKKHLAEPLPPMVVKGMKIFGWIALSLGLGLILLIIWAEVFGYR